MEDLNAKKYLTLFELNGLIKSILNGALPDSLWVTAEIAEAKCNHKGHCYLELVEKKENTVIAQLKANIWAYDYRKLSGKFEAATGETLKNGMKILFQAAVNFHEVYGLSLSIKDIDPVYTLGEMARKKKEVLERLRKEGIIDRNKALPLPLAPQRIAVISSPNAAGYGDFFNQLDANQFGYRITHVLFPALMQGQQAGTSIISALAEVRKQEQAFDLAVIIRGGGSAVDLNCFDDYAVTRAVALFPLPVITGIGHEKDDTVMDVVAHTKLKTPTAVAEFIISGLRCFEERILSLREKVRGCAEGFLKDGHVRFEMVARGLGHYPLRVVAGHRHSLMACSRDLENRARNCLSGQENRFRLMEKAVQHLDPVNVLRRGYSITRHKGAVVKDASSLRKWAVIETTLGKGMVKSIVQDKKEEKEIGEKQTAELLPGFE